MLTKEMMYNALRSGGRGLKAADDDAFMTSDKITQLQQQQRRRRRQGRQRCERMPAGVSASA